MKKIKKYIDRQIYEFEKTPRIWQIIFVALSALLIYALIDLYYLRAEIKKIQKEREALERYPF